MEEEQGDRNVGARGTGGALGEWAWCLMDVIWEMMNMLIFKCHRNQNGCHHDKNIYYLILNMLIAKASVFFLTRTSKRFYSFWSEPLMIVLAKASVFFLTRTSKRSYSSESEIAPVQPWCMCLSPALFYQLCLRNSIPKMRNIICIVDTVLLAEEISHRASFHL